MSDPILPTINPVAYIRTYVPVAIGSLITFLLAQFSWLNDAIAYVNSTYGTGWRDLLVAAATAAVIALYYWGARQVGKRWPAAEKWLLGSSATPVYTAK
jgi:hypothetical protein